MKVIDLLNKIANGEEVPDAIKWGCHDFKWFVYEYKAKGELGEPTLLDYLSQCPQMLNDEIITFNKIKEEKKIPEKINVKDYDKCIHDVTHKEKEFSLDIRELQIRYNQLLDYLKSKGE